MRAVGRACTISRQKAPTASTAGEPVLPPESRGRVRRHNGTIWQGGFRLDSQNSFIRTASYPLKCVRIVKHADYWRIEKWAKRLPGTVFGLWSIRIKEERINEVSLQPTTYYPETNPRHRWATPSAQRIWQVCICRGHAWIYLAVCWPGPFTP